MDSQQNQSLAPVNSTSPTVPQTTSQDVSPTHSSPIGENTPPDTKGNNNKLSLQIGAIALLSVLIGVVVYAFIQTQYSPEVLDNQTTIQLPSPTPETVVEDETSNWETYVGEAYSFKYPADMKITQDNFLNVTLSLSNEKFLSINPISIPGHQQLALEELKKPEDKAQLEDVQVNGRLAKSYYFGSTHYVDIVDVPRHIILSPDSSTISIFAEVGNIEDASADVLEKDRIFNQILSTFEFTQTQGSSISE